jgi:hypothetical protein
MYLPYIPGFYMAYMLVKTWFLNGVLVEINALKINRLDGVCSSASKYIGFIKYLPNKLKPLPI